jgi:nucleoside 2-deoxyribosyltransferase
VKYLESRGHTVPNRHIAGNEINERETQLTPQAIHDEDERGLRSADIVIAEVTTPSIGVGMEIAYALQFDKPVYAVYLANKEATISMMVRGNKHIETFSYLNHTELDVRLDTILRRHA